MLRTYYEALAGFRRLAAICVLVLFFSGIAEAFGIAALLAAPLDPAGLRHQGPDVVLRASRATN